MLKLEQIEKFLTDRNIELSMEDLKMLCELLEKPQSYLQPLVSQEEISEILKISENLSNI